MKSVFRFISLMVLLTCALHAQLQVPNGGLQMPSTSVAPARDGQWNLSNTTNLFSYLDWAGLLHVQPDQQLMNPVSYPSQYMERDFFGGYFGSYLRGTQASIEAGTNIIGIVNYFGDSMTRGDGLTSVLRNYYQTDWFDGGPGWCTANYTYGVVWPAECQLTADTGTGAPAGTWLDCVHGAGGSGCASTYTANGPDLMTSMSNDISTPAAKRLTCNNVDQMGLWYVQQPNGGSFAYTFDAAGEATTVSTAGALSVKFLDWATIHGSAIGNGTHWVNFKITAAGTGTQGDACEGTTTGVAQTCVLGAYCLNDIGGGLIVNKNGATGSTALSWATFIANNPTMFAAELAEFGSYAHTAVVSNVFMDGANDLVANVAPATLIANTTTLINFLQTNLPNADEWIASEPDNGTTGLTYTMGAYAHAQQDLARNLSKGTGCFPTSGITTAALCVGYLGHYENMWNYDRDCILGLMAAGSPCDLTHPSTAGYGMLANVDKVYTTGGHMPAFDGWLQQTAAPAVATLGANTSYWFGPTAIPARGTNTGVVGFYVQRNSILTSVTYCQQFLTADSTPANWTYKMCSYTGNACSTDLPDTAVLVSDGAINNPCVTATVKDVLPAGSFVGVHVITAASFGTTPPANWYGSVRFSYRNVGN